MENIEELKEALCDVRRAHRIIYSYQARMLDLIKFISVKLNYTRIEGATKYFSNDIRKGRSEFAPLQIFENMWAWDFIYPYLMEYYIGEKKEENGDWIALSIIQYSDTGYFEMEGASHTKIDSFASEENSASKLLFIIEKKPQKVKNSVWDIKNIVMDKEYASKNFKFSVLNKNECRQGLYSFPIERFIDEKSSLQALQEFLDFCRNNDIVDWKMV
ncbi:hypothetical protein [Prevotella pallens]|jgi:hypothetical protein|uniref:Uncharacterized protein n=1 Tax=Prevotella pallens TaxID=60133 RepID=A0A379GAC1_9BACT|nr:hypothetical protein [Prevotella pallens]MBF1456280.1 hypothetical protein [Prevotella nigrescens]SUC37980.1 Uncharacterised protein [Prevotella pallens]